MMQAVPPSPTEQALAVLDAKASRRHLPVRFAPQPGQPWPDECDLCDRPCEAVAEWTLAEVVKVRVCPLCDQGLLARRSH